MKKLLALAVLAIASTAHATPDVCEVIKGTATLAQKMRQSGTTAEQMTKIVNTEWMPAAAKNGMSEWLWTFVSAGPLFAYKQDADATPREVGNAAFAQCIRMIV